MVSPAFFPDIALTDAKFGCNVFSGRGWTLKEIKNIVSGILGVEVHTRADANLFRPGGNKIVGSNGKIKNKIQWEAKYSLERSLKDMIQYWEGQIWQLDR